MTLNTPFFRLFSLRLAVIAMLCLWGTRGGLLAQGRPVYDYELRRLSVQEGMATQFVNAICTDATGLLWIGTGKGVRYFDGFRVGRFEEETQRYGTTSEYIVNCLVSDTIHDNLVFAGTTQGVKVIDPSAGRFISGVELGLPEHFLDSCIYIAKGVGEFFWLLDRTNVYKMTQTGKRQYTCQRFSALPELISPKVITDPSHPDAIWLLPASHEIYYLNTQGIQIFSIISQERNQVPGLNQLIYTPKSIFAWDQLRNVYQIFPEQKRITQVNKTHRLYDFFPALKAVDDFVQQKTNLKCTLLTPDQQQILGTGSGLFILRPKLKYFQSVEPLVGEEIRGILTDSSGHWWVGTINGLYAGSLHHPAVKRYATRMVWDFLPLKNHVTVLVQEHRQAFGFWDFSQNAPAPPPDKAEWPAGWTDISNALSICRAPDGSIWIGAYERLVCASVPASDRFRDYVDAGTGIQPEFKQVRALLPDERTGIWVGAENGLSRIVYNPSLNGYSTDTSVPNLNGIFISDLYRTGDQKLWIATKGKGLACLDLKDLRKEIQWYNTSNGLCSDLTSRIEGSHHDQVLWISTHNGLSRLDIASGTFHNYFEESGFPGNEFNSAASSRFPDGSLLFGGVLGLVAFHPDSIHETNFHHKTIISVAKTFDRRSGLWQTLYLSQEKGIQLPPYPEYVEFHLGSTEYLNPAKIRFRYRLHGLSELWTYTSGESELKFVRLAPGQYVLEVQAIPADGHFGQPVFLPVFVATPFYESWWFKLLFLAGIIGIAYAAYLYRLRQLLKEQQIRRQIADDLHDDIGNKLNLIGILAQKIAKTQPENASPHSDMSKLTELSRNALRSLHTMIWSVDSKKDRLSSLITRMQDFADGYLHPLGIKFRFEVKEPIPLRNIDLNARHHIILIYQELLTNMVKYTHPVLIHIRVSLEKDALKLQISNQHQASSDPDFSVHSAKRGLGSIERRLNRIRGQFSWIETSEVQQEITLIVPRIFNSPGRMRF